MPYVNIHLRLSNTYPLLHPQPDISPIRPSIIPIAQQNNSFSKSGNPDIQRIPLHHTYYPHVVFSLTALSGQCQVHSFPMPLSCVYYFQKAIYDPQEAFLNLAVHKSWSAWGFLPEGVEETITQRQTVDLQSGVSDQQLGNFRNQPTFTCALHLIIAYP